MPSTHRRLNLAVGHYHIGQMVMSNFMNSPAIRNKRGTDTDNLYTSCSISNFMILYYLHRALPKLSASVPDT